MSVRVGRSALSFEADCGHLVLPHNDYIQVCDPNTYAVLGRFCSPTCSRAAQEECRWIGCDEVGVPRNIQLTAPAPNLGGGVSVLVTFSDDVPLCDEHERSTRDRLEEILREEVGSAEAG